MNDLMPVTQVHIAAFPDSALTRLGTEAVRRYYEWQMIGPHDAIAIATFDGDKLVGFCFCGVFRGALGGFLEKNFNFLVRQIVTHPWFLLNPLIRERAQFALQRLYRKVVPQFRPSEVADKASTMPVTLSFGILSMAVSLEARGRGIAELMMKHAEAVAAERGFTQMRLTVHPSNIRAVHFYEKMGWTRDLNTGEWAGCMCKVIGKSSDHNNAKERSL